MRNRLAKLFKYALLVVLPVVMLLSTGIVAFAQDWQIEDNKVYIDNSNVYLSASPATLKGSGWVEFEVRSKGYSGELDLVWGIQDTGEIDFTEAQVWADNVEHIKTRYVEEEQRLQVELNNVKAVQPTGLAQKYNYGSNSKLNDTAVKFTIQGIAEEIGSKAEDYTVTVNCDYYTLIGNKATITYYDNVEVKESYKEYYPDYTALNTARDTTYTSKPIIESNRWTTQELGYVVAGETYKARCYIEMPFTGLDSKEYKYAYGVKPSNKTVEQAYLDGSLWLIDPWLDPSWEQRIELTIDHTDVDTDLVDFPVMLYLSAASGIGADDVTAVFDEVGANSHKIAVTTDDEVSECYVEVEDWDDIGEEAWLHVNVPNISSTIDTTLYLYYDNDHADNNAYVGDTNDVVAENVWDANFKAVYHMADGVDNAHIYDSTGNDNDGTKLAANQPIEVTGQVDKAQDFDKPSSEYIDCGDSVSFDFTTALTVETIIKAGYLTQASAPGLVSKYDTDKREWALRINQQKLDIAFGAAGGAYVGNWQTTNNVITSTADFFHTVFTFNNGTVLAYVGGANVPGGVSNGSIPATLNNEDYPVRIGGLGAAQNQYYDGIEDEVRISNIARPQPWIKATNESMVDDFITYGAEEAIIYPPTAFTITQTGINSITLDWLTGVNATDTVIRVKEGSYPTDITDGWEVYNGNLETLDLAGLDLDTTTYYYRAWGYRLGGYLNNYSVDYTDNNIGGENMLFLGLLFGAMGLMIAGYALKNIPVVYSGAGVWAIFAGYCHGLATSIALNTGVWDTYGMLFWIAIAMVIVCMLEPVILRGKKVKALAEEVADLSDEETEAKSYNDMREQLDRRKELYQSRRIRRIKQSKFARTGEAKIE